MQILYDLLILYTGKVTWNEINPENEKIDP
jgi:hypothetical protein